MLFVISVIFVISVNFCILFFGEIQIVESPKTNMASNEHKGIVSLQQVLDSILNNDPENEVSEEESSEEEFDYNDIVT